MKLSARLLAIVDALPLRPGMRILEIGCGPGAMAREIEARIGDGFVLGIDRSEKAVAQAVAGSAVQIAEGRIAFRHASAETFTLLPSETKFDMAVAIRVGALDGRHPEAGKEALASIATALRPGAPLLIDGGNPLRRLALPG